MPSSAPFETTTETTLALKEWGAVACALLDGRQTLLLRKGGIHEKAFTVQGEAQPFVLFPTVAHSHRERVRPEHHDLLACGEAAVDAPAGAFEVRVGLTIVAAVAVVRPERLPDIADLHIWTDASVQSERVDFRPRHQLQALVVRAVALPAPVRLPRLDSYSGCRSWVDLPDIWDGLAGVPIHDMARLRRDVVRVRQAVG